MAVTMNLKKDAGGNVAKSRPILFPVMDKMSGEAHREHHSVH